MGKITIQLLMKQDIQVHSKNCKASALQLTKSSEILSNNAEGKPQKNTYVNFGLNNCKKRFTVH